MPTLELLITESTFDAQEQTTGNMNLTVSQSRIGSAQRTGARFLVPDIPQGAIINSALAYIQIVPTYTDIVIHTTMENSSNAAVFTTTQYNIRDRALGIGDTSYSNSAAPSDTYIMIGDLVTQVQRVVDRATWSPGNYMVMVIRGGGGNGRTHSWDEDPLFAPKLIINYGNAVTQPIKQIRTGLKQGLRIGVN
ncbi:MAG: hypothetical protein DRP42_02685 [Tenericutes bacterium]|nr:MAG: hypothetical protein DRP42_02685 [Mycoplasmatota bacterium]